MEFMQLPNELLENIIRHALPDGFENLALTCKHIRTLCTPFLEHHEKLRWHFRDFRYYKTDQPAKSAGRALHCPYAVGSAFHLLSYIAAEPAIGRYFRKANFENDSASVRWIDCEPAEDEAVARLFAGSPYLKAAGLDWKEYHTAMVAELDEFHYTQNAAAFLLTLLPNIEVLRLPQYWTPVPATDNLLNVIGARARDRDRHAHLPYDSPSMAQLIEVGVPALKRSLGIQ